MEPPEWGRTSSADQGQGYQANFAGVFLAFLEAQAGDILRETRAQTTVPIKFR